MPNWCLNKLTVTHEDKTMLDKLEKAYRDDWTIETFLPTPRDPNDPTKLIGEGESFGINEGQVQAGIIGGLQTGVQSGILDAKTVMVWNQQEVDNELSMSFDSAWSPPLGFYERLVVLGFDVQASYFEPGMSFAGTWHNSVDNYYEGNWSDFPEALQDEFSMHEYYDDMEEV